MLFNNATFRDLLYSPIIVKSEKDAKYQEKLFNIENINLENFEEEFERLSVDKKVNAMCFLFYLSQRDG